MVISMKLLRYFAFFFVWYLCNLHLLPISIPNSHIPGAQQPCAVSGKHVDQCSLMLLKAKTNLQTNNRIFLIYFSGIYINSTLHFLSCLVHFGLLFFPESYNFWESKWEDFKVK